MFISYSTQCWCSLHYRHTYQAAAPTQKKEHSPSQGGQRATIILATLAIWGYYEIGDEPGRSSTPSP